MARERAAANQQLTAKCQETIHQIQRNLGLQNVYRASPFVTQTQFLDSLRRILVLVTVDDVATNDNNRHRQHVVVDQQHVADHLVKCTLLGNSLGIAGDGQFCHLADDGSVVILHNWMYG
jgi:hypothetical protein